MDAMLSEPQAPPKGYAIAAKARARSCVNYTQEAAWWEHVLEPIDHKGADVFFDPVVLVDQSLQCIAHRGKVLNMDFTGTIDGMEHIAMERELLSNSRGPAI
ncbi:hypothetical protein LZ32DRAFT_655077 [Colletotrichum eremochloae]|nr:hypothetical protein LZ32DRAFT_655077 [Colletotrichum eremochloae]